VGCASFISAATLLILPRLRRNRSINSICSGESLQKRQVSNSLRTTVLHLLQDTSEM
jgi:hypothetical protein